MHKCTCDWCPTFRADAAAAREAEEIAAEHWEAATRITEAKLAESRAENERLRAALECVLVASREAWEHGAGLHRLHPSLVDAQTALARPTGGPSDE